MTSVLTSQLKAQLHWQPGLWRLGTLLLGQPSACTLRQSACALATQMTAQLGIWEVALRLHFSTKPAGIQLQQKLAVLCLDAGAQSAAA